MSRSAEGERLRIRAELLECFDNDEERQAFSELYDTDAQVDVVQLLPPPRGCESLLPVVGP